jgi:hypothetical protein
LSPSGRRERPAGRRRVGWFVYLCVRTIVSIYVSFQLSDYSHVWGLIYVSDILHVCVTIYVWVIIYVRDWFVFKTLVYFILVVHLN